MQYESVNNVTSRELSLSDMAAPGLKNALALLPPTQPKISDLSHPDQLTAPHKRDDITTPTAAVQPKLNVSLNEIDTSDADVTRSMRIAPVVPIAQARPIKNLEQSIHDFPSYVHDADKTQPKKLFYLPTTSSREAQIKNNGLTASRAPSTTSSSPAALLRGAGVNSGLRGRAVGHCPH